MSRTRLHLLPAALLLFSTVLSPAEEVAGMARSGADLPVHLRLEGSHNGQDFPVLLVHLKVRSAEAGHLRIRFPEGIDAWQADGQPAKFYQDVRSPMWPARLETEPVALPVEWTGDQSTLGYDMRLANGMTLRSRARVAGAVVELSHELDNSTETEFAQSRIWNCVQQIPAPPLTDELMERTGLLVDGKFRLFRDLVPGFREYAREMAVNQRFTGYAAGHIPAGPNPRVSPHPGLPDDRTKDVYFWHSAKPVECGALATVAADQTWSLTVSADKATSVWTNPGISCLHADPNGGPWKPGQTLRIASTIHVVGGGIDGLTAHLLQLPPPSSNPTL